MNRKNRIVAALLAMIMLLSSLMVSLASCDDDTVDDGGKGGKGKKVEYSLSIVTEGGMPLADVPVYFVEYKDGKAGDSIIEIAATDKNGKTTVKLPENGSYAADISLPEGYNELEYYPLTSNNMEIKVSSSVILDKDLNGVRYTVGSVMHDFTVTTTYGETFTLSEVLKEKKAVLINFWFSTCSPCQSEFPLMVEAYEKYKDDIAIIALNPPETQAADTIEDIRQFQANFNLTFDVAQDIGLNNVFGVEGYPTSVMIDRYGVVTMIEVGAITSQRVFDVIFDYFTGDNYEQKLVYDYNDIVPKEKPNVQMPSSEEISDVFEKGELGDITYLPYPDSAGEEEKEYSWPFVIYEAELNGVTYDVIKTSNAMKEGSFAQLIFNVDLKAGDVLAFDYFSSTELGADIMYVVVDGKDIYSISGESTDWATCYTYVAKEDGNYEVGFVYSKDSSDNVGQDTVYLKDLRIVRESEIDSPTYIFRYAATNLNEFSEYQDYITPVLGADGYYHVNTATGPILLANLMSYTRFSDETTVYYMAVELYEDGFITADEYNKLIEYCNYASNASIYGVTPVTPELKAVLDKIVYYFGNQSNENDWQRICCYYDAYGTKGKQLEDPIKGLALFSAYEVKSSNKGSTDYPNSFTYDRVIMPRGLLGKFTPTKSGTYLITSKSSTGETCNGWIFTKGSFGERAAWLTYENVDRMNDVDHDNVYMIAYLEAGKDYYIDIAFFDVYGEGTINYRVEYLGGEGYYRFSIASPGYFSALLAPDGGLTETISGGIDLVLGSDGYWREKRTDGKQGSLLYADFTKATPLFPGWSIEEMIEKGGFDFRVNEDGETVAGEDMTETARKLYNSRIVAGYNATLGETIDSNDERIGCVIVTEEVAELLQMLVDKYSFSGIENSWAKLCYYHQYFSASTPK